MSVYTKIFSVPPGNPVFLASGINRSKILLVTRHGKVHVRVASIADLTEGGMQWAWFINRIHFPDDQDFEAGEKIEVIYRV